MNSRALNSSNPSSGLSWMFFDSASKSSLASSMAAAILFFASSMYSYPFPFDCNPFLFHRKGSAALTCKNGDSLWNKKPSGQDCTAAERKNAACTARRRQRISPAGFFLNKIIRLILSIHNSITSIRILLLVISNFSKILFLLRSMPDRKVRLPAAARVQYEVMLLFLPIIILIPVQTYRTPMPVSRFPP